MQIINLIQIPDTAGTPYRGTVIFIQGDDPDLIGVTAGTLLKQGDNTWEVSAVEVQRKITAVVSSIVPGNVGLLLTPLTPMPIKGEIHRVV
jgi:hypothetical protein